MNNELFTVIVLLYNNDSFLKDCLDSIFVQDYHSIEIIVVDDKSKSFNFDEIVGYIEKNKRKNIANYLVYQNELNFGTVKSANLAIKKSKGKYIKLLAADDALYDSQTLRNAANALNANSHFIITGDVMKCDKDLKPIKKYYKRLYKEINNLSSRELFCKLCIHNDIIAGGVFFDHRFFERYGLFDESFRLLEDWPTWLNATKNGCHIFYSPFFAIKYRTNGGIGTSVNPFYMADKYRVFNSIVKPSKHLIGLFCYFKAYFYFHFINSIFVRKSFALLFR